MIGEKVLNKEQLTELFDEQRAAFSEVIASGEKYRPRATCYYAGHPIVTLMFPRFEDWDHTIRCFNQFSWLPKIVKSQECILYMSVNTECSNKHTGEGQVSDVFLSLKTSPNLIFHEAAAYYVNPEVKDPIWNDDLELTKENVFSLEDIIGALHFAINGIHHSLNSLVFFEYLEDNGFDLEFHEPFARETFASLTNEIFT